MNEVVRSHCTRWEALQIKGILGLLVVGALGGAGVGWIFDHAALGAGVGFATGVAIGAVHVFAVYTGQIEVQTATPDLTESTEHQRNHIICIDGTWNQPEVPTNVRKLFDHVWPEEENKRVKRGRTDDGTDQIVKYYSGVGARENIGEGYKFLGKRYSKTIIGGVFGYGVTGILRQAYFDFVKDYRPGDRIYIFGFSRGAAIARMLANYICKTYGVPECAKIRYQNSRLQKPIVHDLEVVEPKKLGIPYVELLGVWDTVAALGLPGNHVELFKDLTLPDRVKAVCHLVAIDEERLTFDATLFDHDDRVEEVWFAGAHTNVGGGWEVDSGLSNIALRFMIDRARELGIKFSSKADLIKGDVSGPIWTPGAFWLRRIQRQIRVQKGKPEDRPRIHHSAFVRIDKRIPSPNKKGKPYDPENVKELEYSREELGYRG